MSVRQSVGWTKAEFDAAPRAIGRLHSRVLDLEDALRSAIEGLDEMLPYVGDYFVQKWNLDTYAEDARAVLDGKEVQP